MGRYQPLPFLKFPFIDFHFLESFPQLNAEGGEGRGGEQREKKRKGIFGLPLVQTPKVFPLFPGNLNLGCPYDCSQEVTSGCKPGSYETQETWTAVPVNLIWKMDSNSILENLKKKRGGDNFIKSKYCRHKKIVKNLLSIEKQYQWKVFEQS